MMMLSHQTKRYSNWIPVVRIAAFVGVLAGLGPAVSFAQSVLLFDSIAAAHGLKSNTPHSSVQMTGTVDRGGKSEPFRLIASAENQLRIEYGNSGKDTMVLGKKQSFHDDGEKFTYDKVNAGFSQLDITGLFFVEQLRNRPVTIEAIIDQEIGGAAGQRIRVASDRNELHRGVRVDDRMTLYVDKSGVLVGIERSFYEGKPNAYIQSFAFSEFRKTGDFFLPYRIEKFINAQRRELYQVGHYDFDLPVELELFLSRRTK